MSIHDNVFDLLNEMAEPTGPILSWKARLHIKQYLNHPEMSISEISNAIAEKLEQCTVYDFSVAASAFRRVDNEGLLNVFLDALYDHCDKECILVQ